MEATQISLLSPGAIDFLPSGNKILSSSEERGLTAIFPLKNFIDASKNSINNIFIALNGNKENSLVNKERIKACEDKDVENDKSFNGKEERVIEDGIPIPKQIIYSGKIQVAWRQPRKIGAGLENLGNTCFMNTVIQCLTYCPPLTNYLLYETDHPSKCSVIGYCMMCSLQNHIKKALDNSNNVIRPLEVCRNLRSIAKHFHHGRQEDAHEFLRYVIENLWRSCLMENNMSSKLDPASKETTIVNQIFGGYHRSQVMCTRCKERSNTYDHFMDFILDIKQNVFTLESALKKFTEPEVLDNDNAYKCPKCKMKGQAVKKFTVHKAPNVATFQLKRFDYSRSFGGKITKQITYPSTLNLRPYMSEMKGDPVLYQLNAVLVHSGPTCNSGHYYCYVKNSDGFWYIMDDQRVHRVNINQVLNQSAYVLFYIKSTPTEFFPLKKSFENGIACKKLDSNFSNNKRMSEVSPSKSLVQHNHNRLKQRQQLYPVINLNKRNGLSPNVNLQEKITSFGIPSQSQEGTNKIRFHVNIPKKETGLVPYIEDSSDSSDDNDPVKLNSTLGPSNSSLSPNSKPTSINIKRKKVLHFNRLSSNSTSSKVLATGVWTVTDVRSESQGADSNSSVNSTTDWHVTPADSERHVKPLNSDDVKSSSLSSREDKSITYNGTSINGGYHNGTSRQCDFRKQENTKENSFLKRKCSDSDQKFFTNSQFCDSEDPSSPVSKKIKWDLANSNGSLPLSTVKTKSVTNNANEFEPVNNIYKNCESSNYKSKTNHESTKKDSSNSSFEYEWVEKTKLKDNYNSDKSCYQNSNDRSHAGQKLDVAKELINSSKYFYGSSVPTWNGHSRHAEFDDKKRKSFEDYEDEYDRGKVRKFKSYNNHSNFRKQNSFQHYYRGNFSNNYRKGYDKGKFQNHRYHRGGHHYNSQYKDFHKRYKGK